jgi:peptide deformylase
MSVLKILEYPNIILKQKAENVEKIDDEIKKLISDMFETMYDAPGVGLAAPQVGVSKKVVVLDVSEEENKKQPLAMINPIITWRSEDLSICEEGCLSVPEQRAEVVRPEKVDVEYLDEDGKKHKIKAEGFLATAIQHELDHLDGILYIDHLSRLKRNMLLKKLKKLRG